MVYFRKIVIFGQNFIYEKYHLDLGNCSKSATYKVGNTVTPKIQIKSSEMERLRVSWSITFRKEKLNEMKANGLVRVLSVKRLGGGLLVAKAVAAVLITKDWSSFNEPHSVANWFKKEILTFTKLPLKCSKNCTKLLELQEIKYKQEKCAQSTF